MTAMNEAGYIHIDTASIYKNEEKVGEALKALFASGKKREDIFVTTKIWHSDHNDAHAALKTSLTKLGLDYVDLYLVHWPIGGYADPACPLHKLWPQMEALVEQGLTKSIGVSNFNVQLLLDLLTYAKIKPVCNQVELHPLNQQDGLLAFHKLKGIVSVAYSPIARPTPEKPNLLVHPYLVSLAEKYKKSAAQIILNWGVCRGCVVIPKASSIGR